MIPRRGQMGVLDNMPKVWWPDHWKVRTRYKKTHTQCARPKSRAKWPQVPRMEKFCFCMEVKTGVRAFSSVLSVLWVIYFVLAFLGGGSSYQYFLLKISKILKRCPRSWIFFPRRWRLDVGSRCRPREHPRLQCSSHRDDEGQEDNASPRLGCQRLWHCRRHSSVRCWIFSPAMVGVSRA